MPTIKLRPGDIPDIPLDHTELDFQQRMEARERSIRRAEEAELRGTTPDEQMKDAVRRELRRGVRSLNHRNGVPEVVTFDGHFYAGAEAEAYLASERERLGIR